jgi:hypothetical protein
MSTAEQQDFPTSWPEPPRHTPDQLPSVQEEGNRHSQGIAELLACVKVLADALGIKGEDLPIAEGITYAVSRSTAVKKGMWGEARIDAWKEANEAAKRPEIALSDREKSRMESWVIHHARQLGGRVRDNGVIEWTSGLRLSMSYPAGHVYAHDEDGSLRLTEARKRARESYILERANGGTPT